MTNLVEYFGKENIGRNKFYLYAGNGNESCLLLAVFPAK